MTDSLIIAAALVMCAVFPVAIYHGTKLRRRVVGECRSVWHEAARWERVLIIVLLAIPLPGPLDELGAVAVIHKVRRRVVRKVNIAKLNDDDHAA